jgi:hypothetical protein
MNQQNAREYMPLVQALANGLTIQEDFFGEWSDLSDEISFNMKPEFYRIKPMPRTFDVWINEKTKKVIAVEDGDHDKDKRFSEWKRITVVEVVK